ncbi:MAG TPA: ABC transporter permease [Bryobacteraceae bacterium]|nr:ABC transporter permease [Bryobacteraceae bacterium]
MDELRSATRFLVRHPGLSVTVVIVLAAGIGSLAVVFNVFDVFLLRSLPVPRPGELVRLVQNLPRMGKQSAFTAGYFDALRESQSLTAVFGEIERRVLLSGRGRTEQVRARLVTPGFFQALGTNALLGRTLVPADGDESQAAPPAVLSYAFWKTRFNADPGIIGSKIKLNNNLFAIVGVTPEGFNGTSIDMAPAVRVPLRCLPLLSSRAPALRSLYGPLEIGARLKSGFSYQQAQAESSLIWRATTRAYLETLPAFRRDPDALEGALRSNVELQTLRQGTSVLRERLGTSLKLVLAATVALHLVVCANVAVLLLALAAARRPEMAIRVALGSTRGRLVKQSLIESSLLVTTGAVCGVALAKALAPLTANLMPTVRDIGANTLALSIDLRLHGKAMAVAVATAASTALLTGIAPAVAASRSHPGPDLASNRFSSSWKGRQALLAFEISLCTFLLALAILLIQTFEHLHNVNTGVDVAHVVALSFDPSLSGYTPERVRTFQQELLARVRAMKNVHSAATAAVGLLRGSGLKTSVAPAGQPLSAADQLSTSTNDVSTDYFATLGINVIWGRSFQASDETAGKPAKAVVNRAFAERYFPRANPIGQRFGRGRDFAGADFEIIGVVENSKYRSLREPTVPTFFTLGHSCDVLYVLTQGRPEALVEPVQRAVAALDPNVPVLEARTLAAEVDNGVAAESVAAMLGTVFATGSTLMVAIGLFALFETLMSQRRREIAIRMALGASHGEMILRVIAKAFTLSGSGVIGGFTLALIFRRVVQSWVDEAVTGNPRALLAAGALIIFISLLAAVTPAWKVKSLPVGVVLRHDG